LSTTIALDWLGDVNHVDAPFEPPLATHPSRNKG
jgi:hypothetical protein